jgi:acyl transferase domain-containing protein
MEIPTNAVSWPSKGLRRASVQSFGFGGSNSHIILDDAHNYLLSHGLNGIHNTIPVPPSLVSMPSKDLANGNGVEKLHEAKRHKNSHKTTETNGVSNGSEGNHVNTPNSVNGTNGVSVEPTPGSDSQVLVWSSADEKGIARLVETWQSYLSNLPDSHEADTTKTYLRDLAHTLVSRRTHLPWRTFAVATDYNSLHDLANQMAPPTKVATAPKLAFVFTGVCIMQCNPESCMMLTL